MHVEGDIKQTPVSMNIQPPWQYLHIFLIAHLLIYCEGTKLMLSSEAFLIWTNFALWFHNELHPSSTSAPPSFYFPLFNLKIKWKDALSMKQNSD